MRRLLAAGVAIVLAGCAASRASDAPPSAFIQFAVDIGGVCTPTTGVTGLLLNDPQAGLVIQNDAGMTPLIWSMARGYHPRDAGGQVEVLDESGKVVATTGRKYKIEGQPWTKGSGGFWVCVDPQAID